MLLSLIIAKNTGREDVVRLIMEDRRVRKRKKRKSMNEENIGKIFLFYFKQCLNLHLQWPDK